MPDLDPITPTSSGPSWQHQVLARYGNRLSLLDPVDPLGKSFELMTNAIDVTIDNAAVQRVASEITTLGTPLKWGAPYPSCSAGAPADEVIAFTLVVSALNFCFWPVEPGPRWQVDATAGAFGLANAFARAQALGVAVTDPSWLAGCSYELSEVLQGDTGGPSQPPLMIERTVILNELGKWLAKFPSPTAALGTHNDAFSAAIHLGKELEGFRDVLSGPSGPVAVPFLKRAQLAIYGIGDLLGESAPNWIMNRSRLTAFADYRVPQVLRQLGILVYSNSLSAIVDGEQLLPAGSAMEMEIRAATIVGVQALSDALGGSLNASELDGLLWKLSRTLKDMAPHHRTPTIWY